MNAVPLPCAPCLLHTRMSPSCLSTSCDTTHIPSPVPVSVLVVKNGSKMRRIVARSIPTPESKNVTRIPCVFPSRQSREVRNRITSRPPRGIASMAFATRFAKICCVSLGMQRTSISCSDRTSRVISASAILLRNSVRTDSRISESLTAFGIPVWR